MARSFLMLEALAHTIANGAPRERAHASQKPLVLSVEGLCIFFCSVIADVFIAPRVSDYPDFAGLKPENGSLPRTIAALARLMQLRRTPHPARGFQAGRVTLQDISTKQRDGGTCCEGSRQQTDHVATDFEPKEDYYH